MKKSKGFTLIELMVVIVILGILAAVIAPRIPQFVNKAKEGKTKGNLANLRSTLNIYYSDNDGIYPGDLATPLACLSPKYIKAIPDAEMPPIHAKSNAVEADGADDPDAISAADAGGWIYEYMRTEGNWGDLGVNCGLHTDSSGEYWTTY